MPTAFTGLVGIEVPIVQAPIGELALPELVAAVSNAGGLGMLAVSWTSPSDIGRAVALTRDRTARPFGVNLVLDRPQDERLAAALDAGVRVISFTWGDPRAAIARCHAAGAITMVTVWSATDARQAVDDGADAVVAQGWEAGGHVRGDVATLPLIPAVVDAVTPVPVVAAGGIADGRGVAAVLALGASAAWLGTRFVLSAETRAHPVYRQMLIDATETGTVRSMLFDGGWPDAPHRTLRNSTVVAWEAAGRPPTGGRPGEGEVIATADGAPSLRYDSASPRDGLVGDVEGMSLWAGQSVGTIATVEPAGDIVRSLVADAAAILGISRPS